MKKLSASPEFALFLMRISLGGFFTMWGLDKIVNPGHAIKVFQEFYRLNILLDEAYVIGGMQLIISAMIVCGVYKTASYGLGLVLHTVSVASTYQQLLDPFENQLFLAGVPIWFGFLALFLAREHDTFFVLKRNKTKYFSDDGNRKVD